MMKIHVGNACLDGAFEDPNRLAADASQALRGVQFDTMVGTGFSGALVVPILARVMGKNILLIRKPGDSHHHGTAIAEGDLGDRWVFVDDGIATGTTYRRVHKAIHELSTAHGVHPQFAGAYIYGHGPFFPPEFLPPGHWLLDKAERGTL